MELQGHTGGESTADLGVLLNHDPRPNRDWWIAGSEFGQFLLIKCDNV